MNRLDWRFVDNVVNGAMLQADDAIENADEVNKTTDLMITTHWFHYVKNNLSKATQIRTGEEGILELARSYEQHRNDLLKERQKQKIKPAEGRLYDHVMIHAPSVIEGLSHREILNQIKYFMKKHPEWS